MKARRSEESGDTAATSPRTPGNRKQKPLYGRTDPSSYQRIAHAHGGAGEIPFQELLDHQAFDSYFLFVHRAEIPPKTGIGEHLHRHMEEMYFIFNGVARFTVNGITGELPGPCCVLCPRGGSHGIYNATDETLQWLNVAVGDVRGKGDAIDFGEDLSETETVSPVPFRWAPIEARLLKPVSGMHGGAGSILHRRLWSKNAFGTNWDFIDHCVLPPDTSIGHHGHDGIEEIYYLLSGHGQMTVNDDTLEVAGGDAVPCRLDDSHSLHNSGTEDIALIVAACTDHTTR